MYIIIVYYNISIKSKDEIMEDNKDSIKSENISDEEKHLEEKHSETQHSETQHSEEQHSENTKIEKKKLQRIKIERKEKRVPDIPYSIKEIRKSIQYYSKTCGEYEYARALERYANQLQQYTKNTKDPFVPEYPNYVQYKYPEKRYKRPSQFQSAGRTSSFLNKFNNNKVFVDTLE